MTYALGKKSLANMVGTPLGYDVHPKMVAVAKRSIIITTQDFGVHEGVRSLATQKKYVAAGVSETLDSKHLKQKDGYGHAIDAVPYVDGMLRWEWPPIYQIAAAFRQAAVELSTPLIWGGVWDRRLNDLPATADELEDAVQAYIVRRKAAGKKRVFIDGPHYQLA